MKNENPFFSIIIPCYNVIGYIADTLASLNKQSYECFEVVLVDDCSTDGSYDFCQKRMQCYKYPIILLQNDKNSGPGAARNNGIKSANGKYICFCDSDDSYETNLLELVHAEIERTKSDIVFFDAYRRFAYSGSKIAIGYLSQYTYSMSKEDFIGLAPDSLWSLAANKKLFSKITIANLYNSEDVVTVPLLIAEAEKISFIPLPLYNYFYYSDSLSTKANKRLVDNLWKAYSFLKEHYRKEYAVSFEFLFIKLVLYGILYNVIRCGYRLSYLEEIVKQFNSDYPYWYNNKYLSYLSLRKRIWMKCVNCKLYFLLYLYVKCQQLYFNIQCRISL